MSRKHDAKQDKPGQAAEHAAERLGGTEKDITAGANALMPAFTFENSRATDAAETGKERSAIDGANGTATAAGRGAGSFEQRATQGGSAH